MFTGIRAAMVGATTVASLGIGALPAYAGATSCPRDGGLPGGAKCSTIGNGVLSIYPTSNGTSVYVNYYRTAGGALTAKLGVERGSVNYWWANRNMSTVPFHYSESRSMTASCSVMIGKLYTSGGTTYTTPASDPC